MSVIKIRPTVALSVVCVVLAVSASAPAETINAAGATFPAVIYQKWFQEFHKLHSDVQINYQAIGSGAGIQQLTQGTVVFGASDVPMTDEQISKISKFKVLHFPSVLGAVVATYNIEGVQAPLKFSGQTLAGIFLGTIAKWNDAALKKDNPGVNLPDTEITVVHRAEASGTTFIWTDYLSKVSPEWKSKVGPGASVNWPKGLGGKGNEGVTGTVKQTPNSIGYVELAYAVQNKIAYGAVKNSTGAFVAPDFDSVTEAAAGAATSMPDDFRVSITNAPGKKAYPISSFTWLLIPNKFEKADQKSAVQQFLKWMLEDGQKFAAGLNYAPLPKPVIGKEEKQIGLIQ
jgi:phosphate transport system substrate-binding protein